ncbi:hypothetical protein [Mycetocola miduiensis]|uniref:Uncharacterized protein n=1 Tax=Mycetocola miduiensis TaxID=995034 RepID=A0A1I5D231_9MICO|nr:hypothetical protein [Mycetocola miduiensis]SFN93294.1 hypothetical protein SAMN05216219_2666 [Mycetocola miduiensis]
MVSRSHISAVLLNLPEDWFDVDLESDDPTAWIDGLDLDFTENADRVAMVRALESVRAAFVEDSVDVAALYLPQPNDGIIGAAMVLDVFEIAEGDSPESYLDFVESHRNLRSPELDISAFQSWRSAHPSGELVGYSHLALVTPGPDSESSLEERAVFAIFPPGASQMVRITFRTARLGAFVDIATEASAMVNDMTFDLEPQ